MDFPVTAEFVDTANPSQLHDEARGDSPEWPASFIETDTGWVYRVYDTDEYVEDDEDGNPVDCTRPREGVVIDAQHVQAALDGHVPVWPEPEPTIAELQALIVALQAQLAEL